MSSYDRSVDPRRPTVHPTVHLVGRPAGNAGARVNRWLVRSIMLATTAFALLDLFLLASNGHS